MSDPIRYASFAELQAFANSVAPHIVGIREIVVTEEFYTDLGDIRHAKGSPNGPAIEVGGIRFVREQK